MMDIEKIQQITVGEFMTRYFNPEIPVILKNVTGNWPLLNELNTMIFSNQLINEGLTVNKLWFEADKSYLKDKIIQPTIVKHIMASDHIHSRKNNQRIWVNFKDHLTLLHADVNGLFVFNVQVKGRKHWKIYSPNTPFKLYSFSQFPLIKYNTAERDEKLSESCIEFDLEEGDMLFLPPYWYHQVEAQEDVNININWVATKKNTKHNQLHNRELLLLRCLYPYQNIDWIRRLTDTLVGSKTEYYIKNYAGTGGIKFIEELVSNQGLCKAWTTVLYEILKLPILLKDYKKIVGFNKSPVDNIKNNYTDQTVGDENAA